MIRLGSSLLHRNVICNCDYGRNRHAAQRGNKARAYGQTRKVLIFITHFPSS